MRASHQAQGSIDLDLDSIDRSNLVIDKDHHASRDALSPSMRSCCDGRTCAVPLIVALDSTGSDSIEIERRIRLGKGETIETHQTFVVELEEV